MLTISTEVPKQVCMTKDNVSLHLTSVIYYRITSPHKAAFGIANVRQALIERTQTTLRHVIGARVLQDVIERREEIAQSIREIIEETAAGWGVEVESMLIKDIIFSQDLQDSLSMAAQSKRTGEAKVIAARAEVESAKVSSSACRWDACGMLAVTNVVVCAIFALVDTSRDRNVHPLFPTPTLHDRTSANQIQLMRVAADTLNSAPAMQIRYLEAMQAMAKSANSKVIFLPAQNQTVQSKLAQADDHGEGPSSHGYSPQSVEQEYGHNNPGFQSAINAHVVEHM